MAPIRTRRSLDPDERRRAARLELRVAVDDLVAVDDGRQVGLVRDVEEDRGAAIDEPDDVELPDREPIERECDQERQQRDGADEVTGDHDRTAPHAVDPDTRGQAQQDERQELDRREQAELERRHIQRRRRDQGQREQGDLGPEDADRLGRPQPHEVAVAQRLRLASVTRASRRAVGRMRSTLA